MNRFEEACEHDKRADYNMLKPRPVIYPSYINRDQIMRGERMRTLEPYPSYYDRRVNGALIIAGVTLATAALAEYFGFDTKPVKLVVENIGPFIAPAALSAFAGTTHYVTRKD